MSDLSEVEVIDRMISSLREAMDASRALAIESRKGANYNRLREHLGLIEGCCKQLAVFRDDARYLNIGLVIEECHKRAGSWLRGYKVDGVRIMTAPGEMNQMFVRLYVNLEGILKGVDDMLRAKTGTRGPIIPDIVETRREGRPAFSLPKAKVSGLILPPKYAKAG